MDDSNTRGIVFVTVGTTKFDALIAAVDCASFAQALTAAGYHTLIIQAGSSQDYRPHRLLGSPNIQKGIIETAGVNKASKLSVEWFEYAPSLQQHIGAASLVISHAGAGSIFETLRLGVPLIAVPNPLLMDDHQRELAERLEVGGWAVASTVEGLAETVRGLDVGVLKPYVPGDGSGIVRKIDELFG